MFQSEDVCCYLKTANLDADGDKRICKARFYITPIEYELLCEVSFPIADRLFTGSNGERLPSQEMTKADFILNFPKQSMSFVRDPAFSQRATHIQDVTISGLSAQKLFADDPNFSLIFSASFEIREKAIIQDLIDLLHEKLFITFRPMQPALPFSDPVMELVCRLCDAPNPAFATTDGKFAYCEKHSANLQEGESVRRIRNAVEAAEAIQGFREPGDEEFQEEERVDPLAEDFNSRNQQTRRKRSRK